MPFLNTQSINDAFNQVITDGKASIVSFSVSGFETAGSVGISAIIANAAAKEIAFATSSGDSGSACDTGGRNYATGVGYPASDPNVIGVGGSETNTSLLSTSLRRPGRSPSLARARIAAAQSRNPLAAQSRGAEVHSVDVSPKSRGLVDLGRRSSIELTRIQFVLAPSPTLAVSELAAIAVLQSAGFTIVRTFNNHLVVDAQAGSAAVEQLFNTRMHDVSQGRYGTKYMPVAPITVPAALAPYVTSVVLDDVVNMANPH